MITVTFSVRARALVGECLAQPYPSSNGAVRLMVEHDAWAGGRLVLIDVPTGLSVDAIVEHVAADVRVGLVLQLRAIHNESSKEKGVRIVFTPAPNANLRTLTESLHASFERVRPAVEAQYSNIRNELARQELAVTLHDDDWFIIHDVLADASARRPNDSALADAAHQVEVSLYGDQDD